MRARILFLVGLGVGYVLGARRGRHGYIEIRDRVQSLWRSPQVQKTVGAAQATAQEKAPVVTARVEEAADAVSAKVNDAKTAGA